MADDDPIRQEELDNLPTLPGLGAGQVLFGRYVLESELGAGGMGVVWKARDAELDEPVALKFLPEVVACDEAAVDELKNETRYARRLTHPNIVRVHQFEHAGAVAAISMELVDGMTLKKLRLEQPAKVFAVGTLAPLVDQLCAALDYAHGQANIVHRDIKPANILVTRADMVKVTDFGIARSLADNSTRLTGRSGGASGTILYMSPQQLRGSKPKETDDLYSLGAMLYELLTSKPPFFRGDLMSLRMQILKNTPLPLTVQRAQLEVEAGPIPTAWSETILACLAKEPEGRPQSAGEVARRLGTTRVTGKTQPAKSQTPGSGARRTRLIALAAVLAALGIGFLADAFWPRSHGNPLRAFRPDDTAVGPAAGAQAMTASAEKAQGSRDAPATHEVAVRKSGVPVMMAVPVAGTAREISISSAASTEVQTRYDHARELARQGNNGKALAEYLWCFDEGMRKSPQFAEQRLNALLSNVARLGQVYPPALEALRQRRDAARSRVLEDTNDVFSLVDLVALNRQLGEGAANLVFFSQLPAASRARDVLGRYVFDQLIEARRYPEAAAAQPFDQFKRTFDLIIRQYDSHPERRKGLLRYVGQSGGKELEALAGAGNLEQARDLLRALLNVDRSEPTVNALRDHLERAGHGELLDGVEPGPSRRQN
jgi:hypothetical protein